VVLIVNDQEWSMRSLETLLGPQGYAVVRAYNGRQALELARSVQPDVVILDRRLPDMDGLDVCRALASQGALIAGTPLIVTTADPGSRADQLAAFRAGAWEFLVQPLDGDVLLYKLDTFVRAKREADGLRDEGLLDASTGLYNARGLARRAREIGAEAMRRRDALACIAFAPEVEAPVVLSDRMLDELASKIAAHLGAAIGRTGRTSDAIGRLGLSEFAIIAPATEAAGAVRLAERVQEALAAAPFQAPGEEARLAVRAGYYAVPDFAESAVDAVEMLVRAASALRQPGAERRVSGSIRAFDETAKLW
jgi:two-component system, cell cycle response regulator